MQVNNDRDIAKLQIFFSARNLIDLDIISVTDSFLKVYQQFNNQQKKLMLTTRIQWNDLNPDFSETFIIDFQFQGIHLQQFSQARNYRRNLSSKLPPTLIGVVKSTVGEIFGSRNRGLQKSIQNSRNQNRGTFIIKCEQIQKGSNSIIQFTMVGMNLNLQLNSFCSCFLIKRYLFRIYKLKNNLEYLLYTSESQLTQNPQFESLQIGQQKLCDKNPKQSIYIKFYQQSQIRAPILVGEVVTSLQKLEANQFQCQLTHQKNYAGKCALTKFSHKVTQLFTDYLTSGMQMALVICIDFTKSNGYWKDKNSLHHSLPNRRSKYEQALLDYDTDKLVPTYGFGAKVHMPNFNTYDSANHCFPINGKEHSPNIYQVQGIIQGTTTDYCQNTHLLSNAICLIVDVQWSLLVLINQPEPLIYIGCSLCLAIDLAKCLSVQSLFQAQVSYVKYYCCVKIQNY